MTPGVVISVALSIFGLVILHRCRELFSRSLDAHQGSLQRSILFPLGPNVTEIAGMLVGFTITMAAIWLGYTAAAAAQSPGTPGTSARDIGLDRVVLLLLGLAGGAVWVYQILRNRQGTMLYRAACDGDVDTVQSQLQRGVPVRRRFDLGNNRETTYLHAAASCGQVDVARLLLDSGADLHAKDKKGQTPLHASSQMGYVEVAKLLLARGADVNATAIGAMTPLHCAVMGAVLHPQFIRHIEQLRVRHPTSPRARTALAGISHEQVVELLLRNGADRNLRNSEGRTPAQVADEAGLPGLKTRLMREPSPEKEG
jgi:hypothetical protein